MKKFNLESTQSHYDLKQFYKNLTSNIPQTQKNSSSGINYGLDYAQQTQGMVRNNSSNNLKQANSSQQKPSPKPDVQTKDFIRLQIREKEQQLHLNQKKQSQIFQNGYMNGAQSPKVPTSATKIQAQSALSPLELSTAMQKYHQYLQETQQKGKSAGNAQDLEEKINGHNKKQSQQIERPFSQTKTQNVQASSLNQFVTKVNMEDMNLSRINAQINQSGKIKSKNYSTIMEEKVSLQKPVTPQQKSQISSSIDPKYFQSRPNTYDAAQSNRNVQISPQNITQVSLSNYQQSLKSKISSNSVSQGKKIESVNTGSSLKPSQSSLMNRKGHEKQSESVGLNSRLIDKQTRGVQGYYLVSLQNSFSRPLAEDYFSRIYRDHFYQTYQGIYFAQYLKPTDPTDVKTKQITLKKMDFYKNKISVVFDLDETLVHCNENINIPSDVVLKIQVSKNETINAGINIRPGAVELLKDLSKHFEIIVFTASHSCYAQKVLDYLDPSGLLIQYRLFRESCCMTTGGMYTKDLRIFQDRSLDQLVLVDNAAYSYAWQVDNGIPIIPYYDNKEDRELEQLGTYLKSMIGVKDVREYNRSNLKLQSFNEAQGPQKAFEKLFGFPLDS